LIEKPRGHRLYILESDSTTCVFANVHCGFEYVNQFMTLEMNAENKSGTYGEYISDHKIVEKVLRSLQIKFDVLVVVIEKSKNLEVLSKDELLGSLHDH